MTMRPRTDADGRHPFAYQTAHPPASAAYDPNPLIVWRVDETEQDRVLFDSTFGFHLALTPTGHEAIDLIYQGRYEATKANDEITELTLSVSFPSVLDGRDVRALLSLDDSDQITGSVSVDEEELATLTRQPGLQPEFVWSKACSGRIHP